MSAILLMRGCLNIRKLRWGWLLAVLSMVGARLTGAVEPPQGEGQPFLQNYSPRDYRAGTQCWCAVQDASGVIYIGNLGLVLEYDGSSWRRIPVGKGNIVVGLAYEAKTDTIFVGGQNELGYLRALPGGDREFVSLLDRLPADARAVGTVFGVHTTAAGVFFVGGNRVMCWRHGQFQTWQLPAATRLRSSCVDGKIYVQSQEVGLLRLDGNQFVSVSEDPLFRRTVVRAILSDVDGGLLIGTDDEGMFLLRSGIVKSVSTECNAFLKEKGIYRLLRLQDGSLVIATNTAGLIVLEKDGCFRNRVDETGGVRGNNILSLFEDAEGGVWIGLQSGITRAEINSPLSILRASAGDDLSNTLLDDYWFGQMILGSYSGLYRVVSTDHAGLVGAHLERLPGITNTFTSFRAVENGLLMVAAGSIILLDADAHEVPVYTSQPVAEDLWSSLSHPHEVDFTDENGRVSVLRLDAATGRWINGGIIADTGKSGQTSLAESPQGDLWLGMREHGLFRIRPGSAGHPAAITAFLDHPGPLEHETTVFACWDDGPILFNTLDKLYRPDSSGQGVQPVTEFGPQFYNGAFRCETVMSYDPGSIWVTGKYADPPSAEQICGRAVAGENGRLPSFQMLPSKIADVLGEARGCMPLERHPGALTTVLITGSTGNGVVRLDVPRWENQRGSRPFATLIRRVAINGQRPGGKKPALLPESSLPYASNSVHFEFAASTFAYGAAPHFRTRLALHGSGQWTNFSDRNSVDYLNLPEGRYTFEVVARNADGELGSVASLPFRILPPWQRTPWAYAGYALIAALAVLGLVWFRSRSLLRRNLALEALVDTRTSELRRREADLLSNESALVRARDDAEKANRAKSSFLANMSHELRTPLNAILGYSQLLLKQAELPPRSREQVTVIGQSGGHLLALINEVLDLSKIEAGKLTLSPSEFSLQQLIEDVSAAFRPRFAEKGLTYTQVHTPGVPTVVNSDPGRLRQVLFNLLSNAVKFTQQGGVCLEIRPMGDGFVRFEVTDTGIGIPADALSDIFLAFHQVGENRLAAQGTGLGLAISQRLAGLLGCRIEVQSTPGEGSRFWFDLPLANTASAHGSQAPRLSPQDAGSITGYEGAARRLLLVDDQAENRRVLRDFLQPLGFEIEEAVDGTACLAACAIRLPDALLLDLRLGTPDGFEVARTLRAQGHPARLGIIAVSASVFESDRQQAIDAGCDDFLPKPFEEAQLLGTLGRVLDLRWIRLGTPPPPSPATETAAEATDLLDPTEIETLLELSLRGDIVGIRKRLDALRAAASPGSAIFVRRLEPLVATYQMDSIHALLLTLKTHARN